MAASCQRLATKRTAGFVLYQGGLQVVGAVIPNFLQTRLMSVATKA